MTLQDLRYVVALADHGHFSRAAAACDIGQSTLSTQIKKLEAQLGVMLFERTTKSVSVTAIGAEIAGRARQVLAKLEKGRAETGGIAAGLGDLPLFAAAAEAVEERRDALRERLGGLELDALSPREALDILYELKRGMNE